MNIKITLCLLTCILASCSSPRLLFEKEELTGRIYCKTQFNQLVSQKNDLIAELVFRRYSDKNTEPPQEIQMILKIIYPGGKIYNFNSKDEIKIIIDEKSYDLKTLSTFNSPRTIINKSYISLPSGSGFAIGIPNDRTYITKILFLPYNAFKALSNSKNATFEIKNESFINKDKMEKVFRFKFKPKNIDIIKLFKKQCIDQQPKIGK